MVRVTEELALSPDHLTLYQATDPLLGHLPLLILHGPSTTANYTLNSSRVQVHVYTPAGFQSFPRLTISPNSPFYNVVNYLPREFQGDEVYRALAFGLFKYFQELPEHVKAHVRNQYPTIRNRRPGSLPSLFSEQHAADIAKSMVRADTAFDVIQKLQSALQTQHINNIDIDLVLPPGSISPLQPIDLEDLPEDEDDILDPTLRQYGMYTPIVKLFGEPVFLPTSRLRRAPSKPSALNRTRSFSKQQKAELRRKMDELLETEERYVAKMDELVNHLAPEYRQKAKEQQPGSFSPSEEDVEKLFPRSADQILQINTGFMQALRQIMEDTEGDAVKDMESGTASSRVGVSGSVMGKGKDASGAVAMAKVMLEWFPKFTDCYQDYIRASQNFPQLITSFISQQSSFSQRVAATGEQHLRSTVIEPVQRLPRYSLVIDQIVGSLPITHPALQPMLKARDIIANICSMDDPLTDKPHINTRLRHMIESWPIDLEPLGRLIVAADFSEIPAPYQSGAATQLVPSDQAGIFLLFSDCVVIVRKVYGANTSARDLLREIDKPSPAGLLVSMTNAAGGPGSYELAFAGWHSLADVRFTESSDGRMVWLTSLNEMKGANAGEFVTNTATTSRCFVLQELYEGKAAKWSEEVVKARVEGRFSEKEREDPCWTLRSIRMSDTGLGLFAAVFQEGLDQLIEGRKEPAPVRIVIDHEKGTKGAPVGHYGVEICSDVKTGTGSMRKVMVITIGLNGKKATDEIGLDDFLPTLARRVIQLLSTQFNVGNPALTAAMVSFHTKVLRGLSVSSKAEKTRSFLATSPVKYLSNFLSGSSNSDTSSSHKHQRTLTGDAPILLPSRLSRSNSSVDANSLHGSTKSRDGIRIGGTDDDRPENPLVRLEQTFTGYMASLQARKGNFIGRTLLNRSTVDELSVNDLYNKLIESPFDIETSSDSTPDVIFVAFEKFVRIAWGEQMGPIISLKTLDALQERASKKLPGDFADFVHFLFRDIAPQNRRAFTAVIKLLADLLDGCANDSDRGALTLAFAEVLVDDGDAHNYINLLDRLVEDCDRIFDDGPSGFSISIDQAESIFESMNSTTRSVRSHTGSFASNTSSIRRKFGLENFLSRQNSKNDLDTRPSVWRTLSKHNRNPATGETTPTLARSPVIRTKSEIGTPSSPNRIRRPGSRDRPPITGAFDDSYSRPNSSQKLETIGEPETEENFLNTPRRKRRSSLSDLKSLMEAATLEDEPLQPLSHMKQTSEKFNSGPRIPPPSKIPTSPPSQYSSLAIRSSRQKENVEDPFQSSNESPKKGHAKMLSTSNIPTLRRDNSSAAESTSRPTSSPSKSPGKLRLQSTQKLRERLQTEKRAIEDVDANLQLELSKIAADMAKVNSSLPRTSTIDMRKLSANLRTLEDRVPMLVAQLLDRQDQLQYDMDNTVRAAEGKVRAIDQLYKETMAENEILYEKFNGELGKIVKALKGKGRDDKEDIITRMRDYSEETARVKRENARLRREMASLRALMKGGGSSGGGGGDA
ncbi:putative rho guanyl nucleotide exchange factor protein [Daldinia childiae]|uniref:putative rho guanyl nucleotide exchange factor protein n=1 Tax=Daldinia childiae TaxID=326645 RepID=UPI001446D366|nr:putative rho guanyl nucleotide exchange factor protein [Daldinia childiae]KAF3064073.1 putative rho guanyl nucleotide exchange factor protein [Daldinia childiae]